MVKYFKIFNKNLPGIASGARRVVGHVVDNNVWVLDPTTLKQAHITLNQWKDLSPSEVQYNAFELLNTIERNLKHHRQTSFVVWVRTELMKEAKQNAKKTK